MANEVFRKSVSHLLDNESGLSRNGKIAVDQIRTVSRNAMLKLLLQEWKQKWDRGEINASEIWAEWQGIWNINFSSGGLEEIAVRGRLSEEDVIRKVREAGRVAVYLPPELSTPAGLKTLSRIYPEMELTEAEIEKVSHKDGSGLSGWMAIESGHDAPSRDTNLEQLMMETEKAGVVPITLNEYIVAAQFLNAVTGSYPDQNGWCRLPGSDYNGKTCAAMFSATGRLSLTGIPITDRSFYMGGRSAMMLETPDLLSA